MPEQSNLSPHEIAHLSYLVNEVVQKKAVVRDADKALAEAETRLDATIRTLGALRQFVANIRISEDLATISGDKPSRKAEGESK